MYIILLLVHDIIRMIVGFRRRREVVSSLRILLLGSYKCFSMQAGLGVSSNTRKHTRRAHRLTTHPKSSSSWRKPLLLMLTHPLASGRLSAGFKTEKGIPRSSYDVCITGKYLLTRSYCVSTMRESILHASLCGKVSMIRSMKAYVNFRNETMPVF